MQYRAHAVGRVGKFFLLGAWLVSTYLPAQAPVVSQTNVTIRVMASNLTSGNYQKYESPGLNILKGLKPDIVAMQEFNCSNNAAADFRAMIDSTFGTNFVYFRESGYSIPNGIISRWPLLNSGSWDDTQIPDRGFAWARIDIPGTNDLYVVSVHLKASNGYESTRATEAGNLKTLIQANFPANAWVIVAGDLNTQSRSTSSEPCLATFYTFLSDNPIPTDAESGGDPDTNEPRSKPYDYVLPSFSLTNALTNVVLASHSFPKGLVFDSAVYTPLSDVSPVTSGDSHVSGMQHMGVVKDFRITYSVTNYVTVPSPWLVMTSPDVIRWQGLSNVTYGVQANTNLASTNWLNVGTAMSPTTDVSFTNQSGSEPQQFFRVVYP